MSATVSVREVEEAPSGTRASTPPRPRPRPARRPSELTLVDYGTMAGCAISALALTWVVFTRLTDGVGWLGFVLVAYVAFLVLFVLVTADRVGRLVAVDRLATVAITSGAVLLLTPLLWLVGHIVIEGLPHLRLDFFLKDQGGVAPEQPSTAGGGAHAVVGSLEQVALALTLTAPLAVATAVFLNETRSRWRRPVRIFVDAMSGLPSIVAGLFVYALLILPYGGEQALLGHNGLMAAMALAMIMLPTITRTIEVVLRLVPDGLREASLALGASRARTVWSVVLPTARSGLATAVVLGIARAVGETAPLLFTSFGTSLFNSNPFKGQQESLPLFVYKHIRRPIETQVERGFTGAFVLMAIVLLLFAITRRIGRERRGGRGTAMSATTATEATTPTLQEAASQ